MTEPSRAAGAHATQAGAAPGNHEDNDGSRLRGTRWTVLLDAARPESAAGQDAFAQLYRDYWRPLYSYVRKRGLSPADAEDVTQDFFVAMLAKRRLSGLTREGGDSDPSC